MRIYQRGHWYWVYFTAPDGREVRESLGTKDPKRAAVIARDRERRACDPTYRASHETSLRQAVENFLEQGRREELSAGSMHMYGVKTRHLMQFFGEHVALAKIDARRVDDYIEAREAQGAAKNTLYKELVALRRVLKVARRRGEYDLEVSQVLPKYKALYVPKTRVLSLAEIERLLAVLPADVGAWVCWVVATGCRLSEAGRARRAHAQLAAGVVSIQGTKTAGSRADIPVVSTTRALLERALRDGKPGDVFLPTWGRVRPVLERAVAKLNAEKPFPRVTPNDFRRTFATALVEGGVPIDVVARLLRHRDSRMVERVYGRSSVAALGRLAEEALARGPRPARERTENVQAGGKTGDSGDTGDGTNPR